MLIKACGVRFCSKSAKTVRPQVNFKFVMQVTALCGIHTNKSTAIIILYNFRIDCIDLYALNMKLVQFAVATKKRATTPHTIIYTDIYMTMKTKHMRRI